MSDNCVNKIIDGLDPSCQARKKQGGINKRVWVGNYDDITITFDGDGYIDTIVMTGSPVPTLYKFIGKDFKHNGKLAGKIGENINTIDPTLDLILYYFTPAERAAIEALYNADKLIVFIQGNGGEAKAVIEAYGIENGLKASALAGGTGTNLNDATSISVSLTGEESTLPKVVKLGSFDPTQSGYVQENTDYLDALAA